uniref:Uncharacterized protein n=1 Tax=Arundo donax TaxID=35708 RepID=A0A0A8ZW08_ARUDO
MNNKALISVCESDIYTFTNYLNRIKLSLEGALQFAQQRYNIDKGLP